MSDKKLGVAVIGKPQAFSDDYIKPYGKYVAGCDVDESACARTRELYGIQVYTDYRKMFAQADVDVVFVKTPNHVHFEPTIAALEAGKHVFCEKPMALSMDHCRKMAEASRRHDRLLQIDLELRSSTLTRRVREIIDSGELGRVRRVLFNHYQGAWDHPSDHWRMDPKKSGGIYPEKLVHEVDLFRWYGGEISAVQSFAAENVLPQSPYPDLLQSMFWFENGALGSMMHTQTRSAMNVPDERFPECGHEQWFDVVGTAGSLKADCWAGRISVYAFRPGGAEGTMVAHFQRFEDYAPLGFHKVAHDTPAHISEFLRRIIAGEPELQSPADVLKTMEVTFSAERSIHSGLRETVQASEN